jgi:hypothetical protein
MIVAFLIIVLGLFWCLVFEIPIYAVVSVAAVVIIALVALYFWYSKWQIENAENVARAILVDEIAVYKEEVQNTGFSIGWRSSGRSYFRFKNVLDHYECVFSVVYEDGRTGTIKCRKDSYVYHKLIWKTHN